MLRTSSAISSYTTTVSRITVLLYRQKTFQCSYIVLKYGQFSNVNNLSLYRIKHKLSLFKNKVLTNFAKSFKFLRNKCFGRNKRLLTPKLSTIFVIRVFKIPRFRFTGTGVLPVPVNRVITYHLRNPGTSYKERNNPHGGC